MNATERNITAAPGPSFFRDEDGTVMFQFVLDSASIVGPRPASKRDISEHADAYRIFSTAEAAADDAADTAALQGALDASERGELETVSGEEVKASLGLHDADADGHDDSSGEFVPGNTEAAKPKTRRKGKSAK